MILWDLRIPGQGIVSCSLSVAEVNVNVIVALVIPATIAVRCVLSQIVHRDGGTGIPFELPDVT